MGRLGPHKLSARTPYLTPCDFFFFRVGLRNKSTYQINDFDRKIPKIMFSISQEFLGKSVDAVPDRLEKLVMNPGAHSEF